MARTKAQKKEIIEKLSTIMDGAKSMVFVNFHGLKVSDQTALRRALRKEGVGFFVTKKTLLGKALSAKKYAGNVPELAGEFGLAYGADPVSPARGIYEFQKKLKDQIAILGGVFESGYVDKDRMTAIAAIPPLNVLHGMFVNVINSPIQGLVMALNEIGKKKTA